MSLKTRELTNDRTAKTGNRGQLPPDRTAKSQEFTNFTPGLIQRASLAPESMSVNDWMQLQQTAGNRVVQRILAGRSGMGRRETVIEEDKEQIREKTIDGAELLPVQRMEDEEEEVEEENAQLKSSKVSQGEPSLNTASGSAQTSESQTGMPDHLKTGLENLSGLDLSDIRVYHNSDRPHQVGALAYTQGNKIYIAPGAEQHLPHEGWHAVQQMQGRVKTTGQAAGLPLNDEPALEKEADLMSAKAMQLKANLFPDQKSKPENEGDGQQKQATSNKNKRIRKSLNPAIMQQVKFLKKDTSDEINVPTEEIVQIVFNFIKEKMDEAPDLLPTPITKYQDDDFSDDEDVQSGITTNQIELKMHGSQDIPKNLKYATKHLTSGSHKVDFTPEGMDISKKYKPVITFQPGGQAFFQKNEGKYNEVLIDLRDLIKEEEKKIKGKLKKEEKKEKARKVISSSLFGVMKGVNRKGTEGLQKNRGFSYKKKLMGKEAERYKKLAKHALLMTYTEGIRNPIMAPVGMMTTHLYKQGKLNEDQIFEKYDKNGPLFPAVGNETEKHLKALYKYFNKVKKDPSRKENLEKARKKDVAREMVYQKIVKIVELFFEQDKIKALVKTNLDGTDKEKVKSAIRTVINKKFKFTDT